MTTVTPPITQSNYNLGAVKPWVQNAANIIGPMFGVKTIGGVRNDPLPDHPSGHALDFMITSQAQGDAIAAYAVAHHQQLGIKYVIWNRQYWDPQQGWGPYTSPPQIAYNPHTDHVHITFLDQPGAWTGSPQAAAGALATGGGAQGGVILTGDSGDTTCAWSLTIPAIAGFGGGNVCILHKKAVRQIVGSFMIVGGAAIMLAGVSLILLYGLGKSGLPIIGGPTRKLANKIQPAMQQPATEPEA